MKPADRNGQPWTAAEDQFLAEHYEGPGGWDTQAIADAMGRRRLAVESHVSVLGLMRHPDWLRARGLENCVKDGGWVRGFDPRPWPPHRFEDDFIEAARPFNPDLRYARRPVVRPPQTEAGVPSGWAA